MKTKLEEIIKDIKKALLFSEENRVFLSIEAHLTEQCNEEELELINNKVFELELKDYENYVDFIEDYQPILSLVDFPIAQCVEHFDKRKFTEEKLDKYMS